MRWSLPSSRSRCPRGRSAAGGGGRVRGRRHVQDGRRGRDGRGGRGGARRRGGGAGGVGLAHERDGRPDGPGDHQNAPADGQQIDPRLLDGTACAPTVPEASVGGATSSMGGGASTGAPSDGLNAPPPARFMMSSRRRCLLSSPIPAIWAPSCRMSMRPDASDDDGCGGRGPPGPVLVSALREKSTLFSLRAPVRAGSGLVGLRHGARPAGRRAGHHVFLAAGLRHAREEIGRGGTTRHATRGGRRGHPAAVACCGGRVGSGGRRRRPARGRARLVDLRRALVWRCDRRGGAGRRAGVV